MFHDVFEVKPKLIRIVLGWASLKEVQLNQGRLHMGPLLSHEELK
jgi:hypothetical protein